MGIHLRGIEHGMWLSDPYFFPIYERAQDLDLAVFVHLGTSTRRVDGMPIGRLVPYPPAFMDHIHKMMAGFHAVVSSDTEKRFPRLRWGFVEAGSSWAPAVLQQHRRLVASASSEFLKLVPVSPELLEEKNIFVACQADEDIGYLTSVLGENVLCTGTDYGHNDVGSELGSHSAIMRRGDIDRSVARKIVDVNGRKLLGRAVAEVPSSLVEVPRPRVLPYVHGAVTANGEAVLASVP
jgi:predicted TIM-barrel fold metal-dependent hydrolase